MFLRISQRSTIGIRNFTETMETRKTKREHTTEEKIIDGGRASGDSNSKIRN